MVNMWIRQVQAIRKDGVKSVIDFDQGLNCVIGPSNTGKTRIAKTIAFVCGGSDVPFTESTGYVAASVVFHTARGEVTLSRTIERLRIVHVESSDSRIASGDRSTSRDGRSPINAVLLALLGIDATRQVVTNEVGRKVAFTWNAIRHLMLVPEDQIVRAEPSILLPKSASGMTFTQNLSALLVLAQDETFDSVGRQESASERSMRRKAVERFVYGQLDAIQPRMKELKRIEQDAVRAGKTMEGYVESLREQLEQLERQRGAIIAEDARMVERLIALNAEMERLEMLIGQREALIGQYDSDLSRLDLQLQAMRHDKDHPYSGICQFCHSAIERQPLSDEDVAVREREQGRIRGLREGAVENLKTLQAAYTDVKAQRDKGEEQHRVNMGQLGNEIEPEALMMSRRLDDIMALEKTRVEYAELSAMCTQLSKALDEDESRAGLEKYKPRDCFRHDFYVSMDAGIRRILERSHCVGAVSASFDRHTFDVAIDGRSKADEQGKGFCAFLNTVVMLAFHDYLNRCSMHAPGWLLLDTPLLGFDEGVYASGASMRRGLFACLGMQARNQQIIVLENTDHADELDLDSGDVNVIKFSKDRHAGRYGYLAGVYDAVGRY